MFEYRNLGYTSPSGKRFEFTYNGELSDGVQHNLAEFQFANINEKYFQDRTISSDEYAFTLSITDQVTLKEVRDAFDEKVTPGNTGVLEHPDPTLGSFPVVVASAKFVQNSVNGQGVVRVSVVFLRTIPNLVAGDPSEATNPASASSAFSAISDQNELQANAFAESVDMSTGAGMKALIQSVIATAEGAKDTLGAIASKVDAVNTKFTNTYGTILSDIESLARSPFDLARQIQNLVQLPMLAIDSVNDRMDAYKKYVNDTLGLSSGDEQNIIDGNPQGKNALAVAGLASLAAISAVNYSAVTGESATLSQIRAGLVSESAGYLSRLDIISAIANVQAIALDATERLSQYAAQFGAVYFFNQYFDYSVLNRSLISATIRNLNSRIFTAASEDRKSVV